MGRGHGMIVVMERAGEQVKGVGALRRAKDGVAWLGRAALDQLYPPVCAACGAPLMAGDALCADCFKALVPITRPYCPILGLPFEADAGGGMVSAEALADPPPFARARAAVRYGDMARTLVSRLKYGDHTELAAFCAGLMVRAGADFWDGEPVLVPVPLHSSRLRARRFNQSMLLAQVLGRRLGLPVATGLVKRHRKTMQQVGLSGDRRARNVQGAFSLAPQALARLGGRRVVLIDDVYTTGATVKAVARTLKRGGAADVDVLTFAHVVIGDEVTI